MKEKKRRMYIIIVIVLLILLIGTGIIMLTTNNKPTEKKENKETKEENNLCVENLCITKVSFEDNEDGKSIRVDLKNISEEIIEEQCVKIVGQNAEIPICVQQLEKETTLVFENNENFGKNLKDYKLVKMTDNEKNEKKLSDVK